MKSLFFVSGRFSWKESYNDIILCLKVTRQNEQERKIKSTFVREREKARRRDRWMIENKPNKSLVTLLVSFYAIWSSHFFLLVNILHGSSREPFTFIMIKIKFTPTIRSPSGSPRREAYRGSDPSLFWQISYCFSSKKGKHT